MTAVQEAPGACSPQSRDRRSFLGRFTTTVGSLALSDHIPATQTHAPGLARAFGKAFFMGVAVSNQALEQEDEPQLDLIRREFNSVTGENAMKWGVIRPDGVNWQWERADRLADLAGRNRMALVGHTLVWHSQIPSNVFVDAAGRPLTRNVLLARMQEHIDTLVGRYKGRVWAWDVVNEAVDEGNGWRRSRWHEIIGDDYMEQAFRFAHAADSRAQLLYNDYNMHNPRKRAFLVDVLRGYLDRGVPVSAVGLQSHVGLNYPDLAEWERSIATYASMGLKVHITELDVDVLPQVGAAQADVSSRSAYSREIDPWPQGLPDSMQEKLADRYEELFRILLRYRRSVERVTFWGLHDGISWKNDFPVRGRTNYPLLFDRQMNPKPACYRLTKLAREQL
ncbi:MAG: endo-1,4-beta-xylanase [Pseudomonadota bacterium]